VSEPVKPSTGAPGAPAGNQPGPVAGASVGVWPSLLSYARRIVQIFTVVLRQVFTGLRRKRKGLPLEGPDLVREGLEAIGGSFVKFGQILSLQVDTIPREYCDALLRLLDSVPTCSSAEVRGVFADEFGMLPEALYGEFDYQAIASASIGQVHRARLKDGSKVAIKVQRPGVHADFHRDVVLMRLFVWFIFAFKIRSMYFMRDPVRELSTWTNDELDYRREAAHANLLANNAIHSATERIPKIYWELTTSRVLTMEFMEGPSVANYLKMLDRGDAEGLERLKQSGFRGEVFSANVISNFLRDAFRNGVFHADLHPANLLILADNVVGYVDFGIVATLTPEARRKQIELTLAYASGDAESIYREFLNICTPTKDADLDGMRRRIRELSHTWYEEPAVGGQVKFRVSVTAAMMDLLSICRFYGVLVDREMIKYIRSTFLVDGLVTRLAPGFDLAKQLRDLVEEYLYDEARRRVFSQAGTLSLLTDMAIWLKSGPGAMLRALDLFERRQIKLRSTVQKNKDHDGSLRAKAMAATAVWVISILFLAMCGGIPSWKSAPFFASITAIFVTSWTLWMLLLLRRLATRS